MLSSSIPARIPLPFASAATAPYKNVIPTASQIGITNGKASLTDGFPPLTFQPISSGGVPPFGADFNGILNEVTAIQQWQSAGGFFTYNATFSSAVGGYPLGAVIQAVSFDGFWISTIENNTNNPDATSTGWKPYSFVGSQSIAVTSTSMTLTHIQAAYPIIKFSGVLTGNTTITFPNNIGSWIIGNFTTGAYTLNIIPTTGTGVQVLQTNTTYIFGDGTNIYFSDSTYLTQVTANAIYLTQSNAAATYTTPSAVLTQFNAAGSAPVYACRAWVNFNGSPAGPIRASGNISSIAYNSTGDYTVNFTTAMSDANYCVSGATGNSSKLSSFTPTVFVSSQSTSALGIYTGFHTINSGPLYQNMEYVNLSIFR